MKVVTQNYIGTTEEWKTANPKLYDAVWGFEITEKIKFMEGPGKGSPIIKAKLGNGKDCWNDLGYFDSENIGLSEDMQKIYSIAQEYTDEEVTTEALAREQADMNLQNQINTLMPEGLKDLTEFIVNLPKTLKTMQDADTALQDNINVEAQERQQNDENLQVEIDTLTQTADNEGLLGRVTGEKEESDGSTDGSITVLSSGKMRLIGFERLQQRVVGESRHILRPMTSWELAKARLLERKYQIIEIALYQELCDFMYVGDANNNTADWWYKCDEIGNRIITGLYMRVDDGRGIFERGAGANAVKKAAGGTPYDGKGIGEHIEDAIRDIDGSVIGLFAPGYVESGVFARYGYTTNIATGGNTHAVAGFNFNAKRVVPTSYENRPVSISYLAAITY